MTAISIDDSGYSFDDLEKKYRSFFAPSFQIIIDGKNIIQESIAVPYVEVDTTIESKADSFRFSVANAFDPVKREFTLGTKYFEVGKYVEIRFGYVDKLEPIFYGIITSVHYDYPSNTTPTLNISGMDVSFLLMKGKQSNIWNDVKHSDVVKKIASKYVSEFHIDSTKDKYKMVVQNSMEDFHFLSYLADENNYDFFIIGKALYFRKPLKSKTPVVTLTWQKNLLSFSTESNISSQISQVIVRGWNEKVGKVIEAKSDEVKRLGNNPKTGIDIVKALSNYTTEYVYANVSSFGEAKEKANSALNKRAMELIRGQGESIGIPEIRAGKYIKISGIDKTFSQPLYITSAVHRINQSGYRTSFSVGGNAI